MRRPFSQLMAFSCLAASVSLPAMADDHPMLDHASISVGIFTNNLSADMRVDGNVNRSGSKIDFDRDLGQNGTESLPYISVSWRPWERHEFEFAYYNDSADHSRTLNRSITVNNETLLVGTNLKSKFDLDAFNLTYRYWIWIDDQAAFALVGGLQNYSFDLKLQGTASVSGPNGGGGGTRQATAKASTNLPDPSIGIAYRLQMASWARLTADAGAFKANIGSVDAKLYNAKIGVEFYPWQDWAVVTQYAYNKINADVSGSRFKGNVNFSFSGMQLLLKYRF